MDSDHVKLLIEHKQQEIEDLRRVLAKLQIAEANNQVKQEHTAPRSSTEAETVYPREVYKTGAVVYYCKETRGKRRHFITRGTIVKRDKRFLHIKTSEGDIIRRTPKYIRDKATIEA